MVERHIYSDDFFKFIRDLVSSVQLPELYTFDPVSNSMKYNLIYEKHEEIPDETKKTYINLIRVLGKINFDVLARAHDNAVIYINYLELIECFILLNFI